MITANFNITKRDGSTERFSIEKIKNALGKAFRSQHVNIDAEGMNNLVKRLNISEGMTVEEVERRISGIHCGMKNTSCGDQLARALREAYDAQKNA